MQRVGRGSVRAVGRDAVSTLKASCPTARAEPRPTSQDKDFFTVRPGICQKCGSFATTVAPTTSAQLAITRSVRGSTAPRRSNVQAKSVAFRQTRISVGTSVIRSNNSDSSSRTTTERIPRNTSSRTTPQTRSCPPKRAGLSRNGTSSPRRRRSM